MEYSLQFDPCPRAGEPMVSRRGYPHSSDVAILTTIRHTRLFPLNSATYERWIPLEDMRYNGCYGNGKGDTLFVYQTVPWKRSRREKHTQGPHIDEQSWWKRMTLFCRLALDYYRNAEAFDKLFLILAMGRGNLVGLHCTLYCF